MNSGENLRAHATPSVPPAVSMSAWTTTGDGVDGLQRADVDVPQPGPSEVLLRMTARAVNYRDLLVVNGQGPWRPPRPVVPLSDGVGTVVAAGPLVTRFAVGGRASALFLPHWRTGALSTETYRDPTGGPVNRGMLADYVVVDEQQAAAPPVTLTDVEAATLPVAGLTAWHAVAERGRVRNGQSVLVHGTGGVALFALQFAKALGARVAITSGDAGKLGRAAELGADLLVDRKRSDVASAVLEWTEGRGVDHVVETVGGANLNTSLRAVALGGSISFIGLIDGLTAPINTYEFVTRNVTIHGIETGSREMYEPMAAFIETHDLHPVVDHVGSARDPVSSFRRVGAGGHFGKVVLGP